MRALLVNPWVCDFKAFDFWNKPLGLLVVSSILKRCGFDVDLIDCMDRSSPYYKTNTRTDAYGRGKYTWEEIAKPVIFKHIPRRYKRYGMPLAVFDNIAKNIKPPDVIFVSSAMTYWYPGVFQAIRILRDAFPGTRIVLGGIYATLCEAHAAKFSGADRVIPGPAEITLPLYLRSEGYITDPARARTTWVMPDFDLYRALNYGVVMPSKGCPFTCSYCATYFLSPGYQTAPLQEICDQLAGFAPRTGNVAFFDDALLFNKDFTMILRNIIDRGIELNLHSSNGLHCRYVDDTIARLMYQAGFKTIYLSLESIDPQTQKNTGGKVYTDEFERAVAIFKKAGFSRKSIHAYLLYGLPGQDHEEIIESIRYCRKIGVRPHMCEFTPIPHTEEYEKTGFGENTDPLYHNNFFYTWYWPHAKSEIYRLLKKEISG